MSSQHIQILNAKILKSNFNWPTESVRNCSCFGNFSRSLLFPNLPFKYLNPSSIPAYVESNNFNTLNKHILENNFQRNTRQHFIFYISLL